MAALWYGGTQDGALQWLDSRGNPTDVTIPDAHRGLITDVVITPDGQTIVSSGADGQIRRWDRTGNPLGEPIRGNEGPILALALSPDGQTIVSGHADGTVEAMVSGGWCSPGATHCRPRWPGTNYQLSPRRPKLYYRQQ